MNKRNAYFDNAKFILIFLVVFGHTISPYRTSNDQVLSLYHFIFIFHMPVFILLSGYFSKNFRKKGYYKKIVTKVLVPYLIFQTIYTFYYNAIYDDQSFTLQYFVPRWAMWFLLSLMFWKLMLPFFARLPMWLGLTISLGLGLGIGYVDLEGFEKVLSISRMLVFFPFFLMGYYLSQKEDPFKKLLNLRGRIASASVLLLTLVGSYYFLQDTVYTDMLYGTNTYENLGEFFIRAGQYMISVMATFAFMALIPSKPLMFTSIGQRSLYVYLLHGFILKWFFTTEYAKNLHSSWDFFSLTVIAILVTLLTGSKLIEYALISFKLFMKFVIPKNSISKLSIVLKRTLS
ncbi:acyltransferase family protein [Bacillus songklensis]|uniref:Acyltransferase family protein n=1 Tax=Bacillus songklensis TaxID=1069116 RepID=A0ABV8B7Q8_9BACI